MLKNLENLDLAGYGFYLNNLNIDLDTINNTKITFEFTMPFVTGDGDDKIDNLDRFLLDLKMINALKSNHSPAVREHYEQLLLLLALTKDETTTE